MFTYLLDDARSLRTQLVVGLSVLFTLWIVGHDELPDRTELSEPASGVVRLYDEIGQAGHTALWLFVAYMVGALVHNLGFDSLVRRCLKYPDGPDWDQFIDEARTRARSYGEYRVQYPSLQITVSSNSGRYGSPSSNGPRHRVSSPQWGDFLWAQVRDRERRQAEVEFRMVLALSSVPPAVALVAQGGLWWAVTLAPALVFWLDLGRLQDRTRLQMNQARRQEVATAITQAESSIMHHEKRLSEGGGSIESAELERAVEHLEYLREQRDRLASVVDRRFSAFGRRKRPEAQSHSEGVEIDYDVLEF